MEEVTIKAKSKVKTTKAKITKSKVSKKGKQKTPCQFCEKLFVFTDKHEKNCKKNPSIDTSLKNESIAIKV